MINDFKVGVELIVTHCTSGHEFEIGEIVKIMHYDNYDDQLLCRFITRPHEVWWLSEHEFKVKSNTSSAFVINTLIEALEGCHRSLSTYGEHIIIDIQVKNALKLAKNEES